MKLEFRPHDLAESDEDTQQLMRRAYYDLGQILWQIEARQRLGLCSEYELQARADMESAQNWIMRVLQPGVFG